MIPVRIVYSDTATGASTTFDTELPSFSTEAVLDAINRDMRGSITDGEDLVMDKSFMLQDTNEDTYVFGISIPKVEYFGSMMIHGVVYTQFV